ncbi:MAG: hypothetical protein JXB07_14570 [Anaerolineae bacterium]|nr:hypothetical protein [Anaerolineae bacterium]
MRQILGQVTPECQADARDDVSLRPVRRKKISKWGVVALGVWIQEQKRTRIDRIAWNFFKTPYDSKTHRERFARFLQTLTEGHSEHSRALACLFDDILAPPRPRPPYGRVRVDRRKAWLQAFFQDEPVWKDRLLAWIEEHRER